MTEEAVPSFEDWSQVTGHLDPEDLLISADVDEVMARAALHQLRWCQTREVTII